MLDVYVLRRLVPFMQSFTDAVLSSAVRGVGLREG